MIFGWIPINITQEPKVSPDEQKSENETQISDQISQGTENFSHANLGQCTFLVVW